MCVPLVDEIKSFRPLYMKAKPHFLLVNMRAVAAAVSGLNGVHRASPALPICHGIVWKARQLVRSQ